MNEIVLSFDGYKVWPRVRHLFEGNPGHWAEGVQVGGTWLSPIEVTCPMELALIVMPMLDREFIPYSRRNV